MRLDPSRIEGQARPRAPRPRRAKNKTNIARWSLKRARLTNPPVSNSKTGRLFCRRMQKSKPWAKTARPGIAQLQCLARPSQSRGLHAKNQENGTRHSACPARSARLLARPLGGRPQPLCAMSDPGPPRIRRDSPARASCPNLNAAVAALRGGSASRPAGADMRPKPTCP